MNGNLPDDIGPKSGLLNDRQIRDSIARGFLFSSATCDVSKIKQATYEIRVSKDYHKVSYKDGQPNFSPEEVKEGGTIIIEPGQTIKVLAKEVFHVPANVYARINAVGQIFSAGIAAENTYADPGFNGQVYITLSNISARRLSIKPDDPLARVEFHKLEEPVETPHSGQTGIRKNFVIVETDGNVRELLNNKTVEELIKEMVTQSVDEALQERHVRSEVLIQKAHNEIEDLKKLRQVIRKLRWLGTAIFFLFLLVIVFGLNIASLLQLNDLVTVIGKLCLSLFSAYLFFRIQKRFL